MSLIIKGLTCQRGNDLLFSDLSFSLRAGDILCLKGPNGSGKTTLLQTICNLLPFPKGEIMPKTTPSPFYFGFPYGLKNEFYAREILQFWEGIFQKTIPQDILKALDLIKILNQRIGTLSQGQRLRVALTQLVLSAAEILCLDEPFDNLDQGGKYFLMSLIESHRQGGGISLISSHHWPSHFPDGKIIYLE